MYIVDTSICIKMDQREIGECGVFRIFPQVYTIGHMRRLDLLEFQCFESANQLRMLDQVFKMIIMGCCPN